MNNHSDYDSGIGFVKTKTIEELKAEFLKIPAGVIHTIEKEYDLEYGRALLKEARVDTVISNAIKGSLWVVSIILSIKFLYWYLLPITFAKIFIGLIFIAFAGIFFLVTSVLVHLISLEIFSNTIKSIFFYKQTKFLKKMRQIKENIDSEERIQKRYLELEKQKLLKDKKDSVFRDIETIRSYFSQAEHGWMLGSDKLENSVTDILDSIIEWINNMPHGDKRTALVDDFQSFIMLLANVEEERIASKLNKIDQLINLSANSSAELVKPLCSEIRKLIDEDPILENHIHGSSRRYLKLLGNFIQKTKKH